MGLFLGLENPRLSHKRKFRWLFKLPGISGEDRTSSEAQALPPKRGSRPSFTFKEQEVQHLHETVYFPVKPDWKSINLTLYDISCRRNVVFEWLQKHYNPNPANGRSTWTPVVSSGLKQDATLELYDGCGRVLEAWKFDNCYPLSVEWGDLDMDASDIVTVDITIRYDRAYLI